MSKQKLDADALEVETFPVVSMGEPPVAQAMMRPPETDGFTCWAVDCTYWDPCMY